jgi:Leucine-rich repeat (LRR) protein
MSSLPTQPFDHLQCVAECLSMKEILRLSCASSSLQIDMQRIIAQAQNRINKAMDAYRGQTKSPDDIKKFFHPSITELDLHDIDVGHDFSFLSSLPNLRRLNLKNNGFVDLSTISNLICLEELNLSGRNISDIDNKLIKLQNLEVLDLSRTYVSSSYYFPFFRKLRRLDVSESHVSEFYFVERLPLLEELKFSGCNLGGKYHYFTAEQIQSRVLIKRV